MHDERGVSHAEKIIFAVFGRLIVTTLVVRRVEQKAGRLPLIADSISSSARMLVDQVNERTHHAIDTEPAKPNPLSLGVCRVEERIRRVLCDNGREMEFVTTKYRRRTAQGAIVGERYLPIAKIELSCRERSLDG